MQYIFEIIIPQCHHKSFFPQQLMSLESYSAQWPAFHKGSGVNFAGGSFISRRWFWGTYRTRRPTRSRDGGALQGLSVQSLYCRELPSGHLLGSHSPAIYKDNADPNLFSSRNVVSISQLVPLHSVANRLWSSQKRGGEGPWKISSNGWVQLEKVTRNLWHLPSPFKIVQNFLKMGLER